MISSKMMAFPAIFKQEQKNGTLLLKPDFFSFRSSEGDDEPLDFEWSLIDKHQVSPASHPKSMLKIVLKPDVVPEEQRENNGNNKVNGKRVSPCLTFQLASRSELEQARKAISQQLALARMRNGEFERKNIGSSPTSKGVKRNALGKPVTPFDSATSDQGDIDVVSPRRDTGDAQPTAVQVADVEDFTKVPEEFLAETRAALLAGDSTLRQQHRFLVKESGTLTEEDFWHSHKDQLAEQCARMFGKFQKGTKTYMASNLQLQGKVRLGVEEMRQIFILYPAVHKAYVAKVPLELSEEQFWKKYLESEYFYRDRGKIGQMSQNLRKLDPPPKKPTKADLTDDHMADTDKSKDGKDSSSKDDDKKKATSGARQPGGGAVVAGADDIFTRYDLELREQQAESTNGNTASSTTSGGYTTSNSHHQKLGRNLAVGQFDLASSFNAERPHIGENDLHPDVAKGRGGSVASQGYGGTAEASRGPSSIISKVNRHWAMVLHPMEAKAGTMDWVNVARHSVEHAVPSDPSANVGGGFDEEFAKMVQYADCDEALADHIRNAGNVDEFETLELHNVDAYRGKETNIATADAGFQTSSLALRELQKQVVYSRTVEDNCKRLIQGCFKLKSDNDILAASSGGVSLLSKTSTPKSLPPSTVPPPDIGIRLMQALSKRMGDSNKTDNDAQKIASELPSDFKSKIDGLFRRSSELLRHFFGLRRVISAEQEKVANKKPPAAGGFAPVNVSGFAPVVGAGGIGASVGGVSIASGNPETQQKEVEESKKLERIFDGMKSLYEEMESMRQTLPQTAQGEQMRRMCKPIMDQLDLAFQLHHRGTASGMAVGTARSSVPAAGTTGGGFAPVKTIGGGKITTGGGGFAPVANTGGFAPVNLPPASSS